MFVHVIAVLLIALTPVLATVAPVAACSCRWSEVDERIDRADGAFVGRVISSSPAAPEIRESVSPWLSTRHIFEVEAVVKGQYENLSVAYAPSGGGTCGLPHGVLNGERVGVTIFETSGGVHEANLCTITDADSMLVFASGADYPPIPVSPERERELRDEIDARLQAEIDFAAEARATDDLERSNEGIDRDILIAGPLVAVVLGYALWRFTLNRQESADDR